MTAVVEDLTVENLLAAPQVQNEDPTPEEIEDFAFAVGTVDETDPIELVDQEGTPQDWAMPPEFWQPHTEHFEGDEDFSWLLEKPELQPQETAATDERMVGASLVGYSVSPSPTYLGVRSLYVPGTDRIYIPVRGDVGPLLIGAAAEWHRYLEHLRRGWCWGYAYRAVTGGGGYSFHAAAIAVDLNAPLHPYGVTPYRNFSSGELALLKAVANKYGLRSGAFYNGTKDAMHLEIIKPRYEALSILHRLQATKTYGTRTPPVRPVVDLSNMQEASEKDRLRSHSKGGLHPYGTKIVESALVRAGCLDRRYSGDGYWGWTTRDAWKRWERKLGYDGADRQVGKPGLTALGNRYGFRVAA